MGKLQYDSFYKFLVSAGVVLIAAPLLGFYYLLCNGNQILVSQEEFEALSETSFRFVQQRDQTIIAVLKALPWILCVLIVVGLVCLVFGGYNWWKIQKELDKQTKLKTEEQQANVKKLTATEIAEKAAKEVADENEGQNQQISHLSMEKRLVSKALQIENMCFLYILKAHSKHYNVQQNVRFGDSSCDIIAISKRNNIDYLFEVKYWTKEPSSELVSRSMLHMRAMGIEYETIMHRNYRCVMMIVTTELNREKLQAICNRYFETHPKDMDIRVVTEEDLV